VDAHLTDRDRALLAFAADHRIVLATQVEALLGASASVAYDRLHTLTAARLLSSARPLNGPACYRITRGGLTAIGSDLPTPRAPDLALYRHDVGVGWLWLAARKGVWGEPGEVISERRMRSEDGRADTAGDPTRDARFGVRLGGVGAGGKERRHYPDLLLVTADGHRIAVELELSTKGRARRETILAGYAADPTIDAVLYLVDRPTVARALSASAARVGVSDLVHIHRVRWGADAPPAGARTAERTRGRTNAAARSAHTAVER
jgi:hypothetical protein